MVVSVLAVIASSWGVLMGISPVLQIRQMLRERSSREVSLGRPDWHPGVHQREKLV